MVTEHRRRRPIPQRLRPSVRRGLRNSESYKQNRIDRTETTVSTPNVIHAFGVWDLPFGRNHIGGTNWAVRTLASGWQLGDVYTYASGTPVQITYAGCTTPLQGQCMPD